MSQSLTYHVQEIETIAKQLLINTKKKIWLLEGEVGVGKTTLIKALCKTLGVKDIIQSPSFTTVHVYSLNHKEDVYHFDFYHINDTTKNYLPMYEEYFLKNCYCFVEWPNKNFAKFLNIDCIYLHLLHLSNTERSLTITYHS